MSEDKEALRKEFNDLTPYPSELLGSFRPVREEINWRYRDAIIEWVKTKLKNQVDEYGNKFKALNDLFANERVKHQDVIVKLKAELSRKEEMLKAAKDVIKYSNAHSPNSSLREPYFRAYQTYKTLTNGD